MKKVTFEIIKGNNCPLSSDVAIIEGNEFLYVFECGASKQIIDKLNSIDKEKIVIVSHFHQDHLSNFNRINYSRLLVSKNTYKYTKTGEIIDDLYMEDGMNMHIFEISNSHCKGSLCMKIGDNCFVGDSLAPMIKNDKLLYNVQKLKLEIDELSKIDAKYFIDSHNMNKPMLKRDVLSKLEKIYALRMKDNPYIEINEL